MLTDKQVGNVCKMLQDIEKYLRVSEAYNERNDRIAGKAIADFVLSKTQGKTK